ncbi:MAG: ZIP family metal transporter [Euryarchaeota archaeon]|nr:ZIP family metal transporter [Euryarchaeota archaeon]MDE1836884.1 ZIP family metal transporter [Euryarchaeota archaeon]MDE1881354.1 ZIP family metal transporter [Euryarchaeota archaeon]MDE2045287.1 ZIP family metal transporter [Thermoplasmata archaeon]
MTGPTEWQILGLGAFAGFTIFLGLLVALGRNLSRGARAFLSALAAGILLFLFFDVLNNAHEMVVAQIPAQGGGNGSLALAYVVVLLVGWTAGFLSLGAFEKIYVKHTASKSQAAEETVEAAVEGRAPPPFTMDALTVSTMIAIGIGLHNFSEGLAIGTAYAGGALAAGTVLVIGFASHNATEGFGILGPGLLSGKRYSPRRLISLGLVGGGPTFLGTVVGSLVYSSSLSILFFGLAAGAIIYVVLEMVRPMMAPATKSWVWFGIVLGFILGIATDTIVSFGGA